VDPAGFEPALTFPSLIKSQVHSLYATDPWQATQVSIPAKLVLETNLRAGA
jgi:hypothetical protein